MAGTTHHKVLIVGGGTAGITVAASLKRHGPGGIDIAIVEPSDTHYYQPAFTLVGAGVYDLARTRRTTESLVPSGVKRIKAAAHKFDPANNKVELSTGDAVAYAEAVAFGRLQETTEALVGDERLVALGELALAIR